MRFVGICLSFIVIAASIFFTQTAAFAGDIDLKLRDLLAEHGVVPLEKEKQLPAKVKLGRLLFFDRILSGNKNISCATCHLPEAATSDALPFSIGEGGVGKMTKRVPPKEPSGRTPFSPRNSLDVFNRGSFITMFWDGRVTSSKEDKDLTFTGRELRQAGKISSPAGFSLPDGLENALAAQAMFPPVSDVEMRGNFHENRAADFEDWDYENIWAAIFSQVFEVEEYHTLFKEAYPDLEEDEFSFVQIANAIAAFEIEHFTLLNSPFDRYLQGDDDALLDSQKRGALLFYGQAGCGRCHSGALLTDQQFHNRIVPQIGPGKGDLPSGGDGGVWDFGRGGVTGRTQDYYSFRTPPLHNVAKTGPWMHDGAFSSLESAVRHELNPLDSANNYAPNQHLSPEYASLYREEQTAIIVQFVDLTDLELVDLEDQQVKELIDFLEALTSPNIDGLDATRPDQVPSGLDID